MLKVLAELRDSEPFYSWLSESFKKRGIGADFHYSKSQKERLTVVRDYEIIIPAGRFSSKEIDAAGKLKMIHTIGIGFDHVDVNHANKKGILVCNVGGTISETVAEHAWALILALMRRIVWGHMEIVKGTYLAENYWGYELGHDIWGKTLGIIGLGNVGRRVARIARAFDMKIFAYDPYLTEDVGELHNAQIVDIRTLLRNSDIVSICIPLTDASRSLIGRKELSMMKKTAYLVNVARGRVIQEEALIESLKKGEIAGAGLDVFETEPLPLESPLRKMKNVILTPHSAGPSEELAQKSMGVIAENVSKFMKGETPKFAVNKDEIMRIQARS